MKTVLIFTGHARTFRRCWPNIRWNFVRKCPGNTSLVASFVNDGDGADAERVAPWSSFELVDQANDVFSGAEKAREHAPFYPSVPTAFITRQLWHIRRGWLFATERGELHDADFVVRIRPDIWFLESKPDFVSDMILTPWWGTFGGVNDRLATMPAFLAKGYFDAYSNIERLLAEGCPMHPESIMRACVERHSWSPTLDCLFETVRADGKNRPPEILTHELRR